MKISISQQNELVKIDPKISRTVFPHKLGRGDRRVTTDFTSRSRKNLLEKFATLDPLKAKSPLFITLTYITNFQDHKEAYRHIDLFLKRIAYKYPAMCACWRKELQERGAIHFHLMIWGVRYIPKQVIGLMWGKITGQWQSKEMPDGTTKKYSPFTRVERCQNRRKAWYYVSKYISKAGKEKMRENGIAPLDKGKISDALNSNAGVSGYPQKETFNPLLELAGALLDGFNYGTNSENLESTGRWWGWFNRKNIPLAEEIVTEIEVSWAEYKRFRWDLRWMAGHTAQIHDSHTVKMFWFPETFVKEKRHLEPTGILIRGILGEVALK